MAPLREQHMRPIQSYPHKNTAFNQTQAHTQICCSPKRKAQTVQVGGTAKTNESSVVLGIHFWECCHTCGFNFSEPTPGKLSPISNDSLVPSPRWSVSSEPHGLNPPTHSPANVQMTLSADALSRNAHPVLSKIALFTLWFYVYPKAQTLFNFGQFGERVQFPQQMLHAHPMRIGGSPLSYLGRAC
eukprot:6462010-Amphidinium_carterae.1